MSKGLRYKFQGSRMQVGAAYGTPKLITVVTKANPAVVTAAAHGMLAGDVGLIENISDTAMTQFADGLYVVDDTTVNSFEPVGVDSTTYGTFAPNSPNTAQVSPVVFSDFCELTGLDQADGTSDEIEVTTICSTAKEFEVGLGDSGTATLNYNFAPNSPIMAALREAKRSGAQVAFRVVFPNGGGTVIMLGYVQAQNFSGANSGVWTGSATIKLTGEIVVLEAA